MRTYSSVCLLLAFAAGPAATGSLLAYSDRPHAESGATGGVLVPVTEKTDAAWLTKARADYPLTTCSVSGDDLDSGDMGKPLDYVYKQPGKPDRLIRFCCKDCLKDFRKDPAKYLKTLDDAAARKEAKQS